MSEVTRYALRASITRGARCGSPGARGAGSAFELPLRTRHAGKRGVGAVDDLSVAVVDFANEKRIDQKTAIGEYRIAARHRQRRHGRGAERHRQTFGNLLRRETKTRDVFACVVN